MIVKKRLAVDPGQDGGIALLVTTYDDAGCLADVETYSMAMPTKKVDTVKRSANPRPGTKVKKAKYKTYILAADVVKFLSPHLPVDSLYIEKVSAMPGQGVTSMFSFGKATGKIEGICEALTGLEAKEVAPTKWKNTVLKAYKDKDKKAAIDYCKKTYPRANLLATARSRVSHDGIADALCIATYSSIAERAL